MKQLLLSLTALVFTLTSFAINPSEKVLKSFGSSFATATNIQWNDIPNTDMVKASFTFKGDAYNAFYDAEGKLLNLARYINKTALPEAVQQQLDQRFGDYAIRTVIESLNDRNNTCYYVTIESAKDAKIVECKPNGKITLFKKLRK